LLVVTVKSHNAHCTVVTFLTQPLKSM